MTDGGHPFQVEDFASWAEEDTRKLDAILRGQADAKKRMVELIAALKTKDDWDESVLAMMNAMAEQILESAGESTEAISLAEAVRERAAKVERLLADKAYADVLAHSIKQDDK